MYTMTTDRKDITMQLLDCSTKMPREMIWTRDHRRPDIYEKLTGYRDALVRTKPTPNGRLSVVLRQGLRLRRQHRGS